jgi:hypothetical protein
MGQFSVEISCVAGSTLSGNQHINETIDASVFDKWRDDKTYRPKNLSEWASRRKVTINDIRETVRADDPKVPLSRIGVA